VSGIANKGICRFVLIPVHLRERLAEWEEFAQGAGVEAGVADLPAGGELDFAAEGRVGEGGGQAGLGVHVGFECEGAASTSAGRGHLFDLGEFDFAAGMEALHVGLAGALERFAVFVPDNDRLGEESVGDGVLRLARSEYGPRLTLGSLGAAGAGAIGAGRGAAFFGRHDTLGGRWGPRQAGGPGTGKSLLNLL
jgi:hypothetical protein